MKTFKTLFTAFILSSIFASASAQSIVKQKLDSILTIGENSKVEYFYNEKGNNTSFIGYRWSSNTMAYEPKYKREFSYNELKQITSDQYFTWDNTLNQWAIINRTDKSYDENGQVSLSNYYEWNKNEKKWDFLSKTDYTNTYDSGNKRIQAINSFTTNKGSTEIIKKQFTFGINLDYLLVVTSFNWQSNQWVESKKEYYSRDSKDNIGHYYNGKIGFGVTYDNNFTFDQLLVPAEYFPDYCMLPSKFDYKHIIISIEENGKAWKRNYYYSSMVLTGTNEPEKINITIFPNPADEYFKIQWTNPFQEVEMDLHNIAGGKVINRKIQNNSKVSLIGLSKGIYLITLKKDNEVFYKGKIILK
jgi:hypothetical protein